MLMTKTVHPVLKKTGAVLLTVLVLVLMAVPAFAVAVPDAPTGDVYDGANVRSSSTESYIERTGSALAEACGAEVVVATVDFTDGEDIADYAYDLFNKWGIGDKKANNGLLILLSVGAEDYYAEPGVGLTDVFTGGVLDAMLYDYLEDDFAAKEYDSGVKKVYARAVEILEDHYNVSYSTGTTNDANANTNYNYANNNPSGGFLSGVQNAFSQARRVAVTRIIRFVFIVLFFCSSYFMSRCRTPGLLQEFVKIIAPGVQAFRLVHQYHVFRKEAPYLSQCPASRGVVVEKGVHLLIL